jgi:hypothetical protein
MKAPALMRRVPRKRIPRRRRALKTTAQKLMTRVRLYVAPKG